MKFWDRVYFELKNQGKKKSDLWKYLEERRGVSVATSSKWSMLNRLPDVELGFEIARFLDVSVDFLITGDETSLPDDDYVKQPNIISKTTDICTSNGKTIKVHEEEPTVLVPVYSQKLSAGHGEDFLNDNDIIGYIRVLTRMLRGIDPATIGAAEVKGDSMIDIQIFNGDLVIFAKGLVEENGIYVVSLSDSVLVKRLEFKPFKKTVSIISENKSYSLMEVDATNEDFIIQGKVLGWIHCHPY